jgi:EAL domain-containing protein (putative c-di-GMP-specific phosphodiesterase class I)
VQWLRPRLAVWHAAPAQFTVNLATTTVHDPAYLELVEHGLKKAQLPTGLIAFEVDQALCRREPRRIESLANLLQQLGSALVIDNFTLHDDSVKLLMLPGLSMVKIDRELTGEALVSRAGQARLAGLAHMAKVAGVQSVAKKVDGENEHALLAALGLDFAQGFAIAAPAPINAIDSERRLQLIDPTVSELANAQQRQSA